MYNAPVRVANAGQCALRVSGGGAPIRCGLGRSRGKSKTTAVLKCRARSAPSSPCFGLAVAAAPSRVAGHKAAGQTLCTPGF